MLHAVTLGVHSARVPHGSGHVPPEDVLQYALYGDLHSVPEELL